MGLSDWFKRYGDLDFLTLKFDPGTKQYVYKRYGELIPYKKLSSKYKKILKAKNKELIKNPLIIDEEIQKIEYENKITERFKEMKALGYGSQATYIGSDIPTAPIPKAFDEKLTKMLSEEKVLYGLHRAGQAGPDDIEKILTDGLDITGGMSLGLNTAINDPELGHNVAYYYDNMDVKEQMLNAHGWRHSNGSFLIRIPDEDKATKDIFIREHNNYSRLKPEYIVGYVPLTRYSDGSVTIDKILTLEDIKKMNEQKEENVQEEVIKDYTQEIVEEEKIGRSR